MAKKRKKTTNRPRISDRKAPQLPTVPYTSPDGRMTLDLGCAMTPKTRLVYAETIGGEIGQAAMTREDVWHRAVEFLFERLVMGWSVDDVPTTGQKALIQRFRVASAEERTWIRTVLREHLTEWFPEMQAP
ncbi:hypothetical protein [Patulibacter minatonensis]|uniref:hypothetical protein n=1 Tax=Patulibacter minatonensis TaxID=298163 RepID=UPI00047C6E02|nr:hypothetical protein [Patulibacter minatonensis]